MVPNDPSKPPAGSGQLIKSPYLMLAHSTMIPWKMGPFVDVAFRSTLGR